MNGFRGRFLRASTPRKRMTRVFRTLVTVSCFTLGSQPYWVQAEGSAPGTGTSNLPEAELGSYTFEPGWTLASFPSSGKTAVHPQLQSHGLTLWTATSTGADKIILDPKDPVESNVVYWVHADRHIGLTLKTDGTEAVDGEAPSPRPPETPGWHLVSVEVPRPYGDPNIIKMLRWDAQHQAYRRVRLGQMLTPGQGYRALFGQAARPFAESCLPATWNFLDAARMVERCPFSFDPSEILPPATAVSSNLSSNMGAQPGARLILQGTGTEPTASPEQLASANTHFVIQVDPNGVWQIHGEPQKIEAWITAKDNGQFPDKIHVAVAGTYVPVQASHYENTAFGYAPNAPENDKQPPSEAVIRLAELVHYLTDELGLVSSIENASNQPLPPHLVDALGVRFLNASPSNGTDHESEELSPTSNPAPTLVVLFPPEQTHHTNARSLVFSGQAFDEDLQAVYINGVPVHTSTRAFSHLAFLDPGKNSFEVLAVDSRDQSRRLWREVNVDTTHPQIEASVHSESEILRFQAKVIDAHLADWTLNGEALPRSGQFVHKVHSHDLPLGASVFAFRATDLAQNSTEHRITVRKSTDGVSVHAEALKATAEAATEAPASVRPPALILVQPEQDTHHVREPRFVLKGEAITPAFAGVTINGVLTSTVSGAFETELRLGETQTPTHIVVHDQYGRRDQRTLELVYDAMPPKLHTVGGQEQTVYLADHVITGTVEEPHLAKLGIKTSQEAQTVPLELLDGRFQHAVFLEEGENLFELYAEDHAGNTTTERIVVRYETILSSPRTPLPPAQVFAAAQEQSVILRWRAPRLFEDGTPIPPGVPLSYRVYREANRIAELDIDQMEDTGLERDRTYTYYVTTVLPVADGLPLESEPSELLTIELATPAPIADPGHFETPSFATPEGVSAVIPKVALSSHQGQTLAHLVYVAQSDLGEELRVVRSEKAGQAGSFSSPTVLFSLEPGWIVTDAAVASQDAGVVVAWISEAEKNDAQGDEGESSSRVHVWESYDGGKSFSGAPTLVRQSKKWKRGIDVGYDRSQNVHLVWGEAHKALYLKNFEGEPVNVFDETKRDENLLSMNYHRTYHTQKQCGSCTCTTEEHEVYPFALEENPDTHEPFGAHFYRTEEAYVYSPALHIDDNRISIVVRQDRMWDNRPVRNPDWLGEHGPKTPPERQTANDPSCPLEGQTRWQMGFRKTWKTHAGEPNPARPLDEPAVDTEEAQWAHYEKTGVLHAYDDSAWHPKDWYQYLYEGSWHDDDLIKVAQRPIEEGSWAEAGWTENTWQDDTHQSWRISILSRIDEKARDGKPSHPTLFSDGVGRLFAAYENGTSEDPNAPGNNALYIQSSDDGGVQWSEPQAVGVGYMPKLGITDSDDRALIYYSAEQKGGGAIRVLRRTDPQAEYDSEAVNHRTPLEIHWKSHGRSAGRLIGAPALATHGDLHLAAWVDAPASSQESKRIVVARASPLVDVHAYHVSHRAKLVSGKSAAYSVTAVNKYHMSVDTDQTVELSRTNHSDATETTSSSQRAQAEHASAPADSLASKPVAAAALVTGSVDTFTVSLKSGQGTFWASWEGTEVNLSAQSAVAPDAAPKQFHLLPGDVRGNYERAITARDRMLVTGHPGALGIPHVYQVEYEPDQDNPEAIAASDRLRSPELWEDPALKDAKHLAGFKRVWVYTQGIALAQFSRSLGKENQRRAQGLAAFLCDHAKTGTTKNGETVIKGWPFSWNTDGDGWEDARLVTGANAWTIHGLGAFLVSDAFYALSSDDQQDQFRLCYKQSLRGLAEHRQNIVGPEGQPLALMSAGWTTLGLKRAGQPSDLRSESGVPLAASEQERWAYYSVLDAIGYNELDPENPPSIVRWEEDTAGGRTPLTNKVIEDPAEFRALKAKARAETIVTEHNLDTLAVLNHAIEHAEEIGLDNKTELESWRNTLREGVFELLWDDQGWRADLEKTLAVHTLGKEKVARIEDALKNDSLGRMITGGTLSTDENSSFHGSIHAAIDNCSWLSLSVDYKTLPDTLEDRLARCLEYTYLQFAKKLSFESKQYYGTHYFQNAFRDPYIEPSELQEASFHLEATTGLILGLLYFADARPDHPQAEQFRDEALRLWAGVQAFVRDHGFPYSSQRIQDLSTLLSSSTALIWFIDVRDYLQAQDSSADRPLLAYARDIDPGHLETSLLEMLNEVTDSRALISDEDASVEGDLFGHLIVSGTTDGSRFTLVQDQALGIIAAVNHNDKKRAIAWARGLLSLTKDHGEASAGRAMTLPFAVTTLGRAPVVEDHITLPQVTAVYAMAWLLTHVPELEAGLRSELQEAIRGLIGFLDTFSYWGARTDGVALYTDSPMGGAHPPIAWTEDNVIAYFALREAQKAFAQAEDPSLSDALEARAEALKHAIASVLWNEDSATPLIGYPKAASESALKSTGVGGSAMALYAAFSASIGDRTQAEASLTLARAYHAATKDLATPDAGAGPKAGADTRAFVNAHRGGWSTLGVETLWAHRTTARFDARRTDIAALELNDLLDAPLTPSARLGALIAGHMDGAFGHFEYDETIDKGQLAAVATELVRIYAETVGALLAQDPHPHVFDHLFTQLVHIRFVEQGVEQGQTPQAWIEAKGPNLGRLPRQVAAELLNPCGLNPQKRAALERYVGIGCEVLSRAFEDRVLRRGVRPDALEGFESMGVVLSAADQKALWDTLLARLGHTAVAVVGLKTQEAPVGVAQGTWDFLESTAPLTLPSNATQTEIQSEVRARIKDAIWTGVRNAVLDEHVLTFAWSTFDPIAVFHTESPSYFSRLSLELRVLQDFDTPVEYRAQGIVSAPGPVTPDRERILGRRALRRFVNTYAEGELARFSSETGLSADLVHQVLKNGQMSETFLSAIIEPYAAGNAEALLALLPDPTPAQKAPTFSVPPTAAGFLYTLTAGGALTNPGWYQVFQELARHLGPALVPALVPDADNQGTPNNGVNGPIDPFGHDPCGVQSLGGLQGDDGYTTICVHSQGPSAWGPSPSADDSSVIPEVGSIQEALDALWFYSPFKPAIIIERGALEHGYVSPRVRGDFVDLIVRAEGSEAPESDSRADAELDPPNAIGIIELRGVEKEATPEGYLCTHDPELVHLFGTSARELVKKWRTKGRDVFHLNWRSSLDPRALAVYRDFRRLNPSEELSPNKGFKINLKKAVRPVPGVPLYCIPLSELENEQGDNRTVVVINPEPRSLDLEFDAFLHGKPKIPFRARKIAVQFKVTHELLKHAGLFPTRAYVTLFKMRKSDIGQTGPTDQIVHIFNVKNNKIGESTHEFGLEKSLLGEDPEDFLESMETDETLFASFAVDIGSVEGAQYIGTFVTEPEAVIRKDGFQVNSVDEPPPPPGAFQLDASALALLGAQDWSKSVYAYGELEPAAGAHLAPGAGAFSAADLARPELVQQNILITTLTEAAVVATGREALKALLMNIIAIGVHLGVASATSEKEVDLMVELMMGHSRPNIVVVEPEVQLAPLGPDFEYITSIDAIPDHAPDAIYDWVPTLVSTHGEGLDYVYSKNLLDNIGFHAESHVKEEWAQKLRGWWSGKLPQDVVLKKTWDGVEVYRAVRWTTGFSTESPLGTVIQVTAGDGARVVYTHPVGFWHDWYQKEVRADDVPSHYSEVHRDAVDHWLLNEILGTDDHVNWRDWRENQSRTYAGHHDGSTPFTIETDRYDAASDLFLLKLSRPLAEDEMLVFYCSSDPRQLDQLTSDWFKYALLRGQASSISTFYVNSVDAPHGQLAPSGVGMGPGRYKLYCRFALRTEEEATRAAFNEVQRAFQNYIKGANLDPYTPNGELNTKQFTADWLASMPFELQLHAKTALLRGFRLGLRLDPRNDEALEPSESVFSPLLGPFELPITDILLRARYDSDAKNIRIEFRTNPTPGSQFNVRIYRMANGEIKDTLSFFVSEPKLDGGDWLFRDIDDESPLGVTLEEMIAALSPEEELRVQIRIRGPDGQFINTSDVPLENLPFRVNR